MSKKYFLKTLFINAVIIIFGAFAAAQTPTTTVSPTPEPTPIEDTETLRIDTEEISINVRVIDGRNRPVNDLNRSHFSVYEDNVLQPITSFSTAQVPVIGALLIDNSRSLRGQLAKVIDAGKILVAANRPSDEISVIRFVSSDKIDVMRDFTSNRNLLNEALDNLYVEGGQTAIVDAVYRTVEKIRQYKNSQAKDDFRRRTLIVVSDGFDQGSLRRESELLELLGKSDLQIYTIGFVANLADKPGYDEDLSRQQKARTFLTQLASTTGGKAYFPASLNELPNIAEDILAELRTQYLLTYAPTNENRSSRFSNIKVVISDGPNNEKRTAVTRTGRIAGLDGSAPQQISQKP